MALCGLFLPLHFLQFILKIRPEQRMRMKLNCMIVLHVYTRIIPGHQKWRIGAKSNESTTKPHLIAM